MKSRQFLVQMLVLAALGATAAGTAARQTVDRHTMSPAATYVPSVTPLPHQSDSELRDLVERLIVDRAALARRYSDDQAAERRAALREYVRTWRAQLAQIPFDTLGQEGRIDYILLRNRLDYQSKLFDREDRRQTEMSTLIPFGATISALHESRRRMEDVDPRGAAATLAKMADDIDNGCKKLESGDSKTPPVSRIVALRAANEIGDLKRLLEQWFKFHDGYSPLFSWWVRDPYKRVDGALTAYVKVLRERVVGYKEGEDEPIVGDPIGREGILEDLDAELISYSPEELVEIAKKEYAWCEAEMIKASRELGFGDEWRKALEKVKNLHVEPGKQTAVIRQLAHEAVDFIEKRDLVTVPPLAKDIWRVEMMTPAQQKVSPFFLGGEVILVSYPTDAMEHADKLMSMRGNNTHFSRATVQHELIPGHHLQGFMNDRYNTHRRAFETPFWGEGWALYWEMILWDLGFPQSPEDRVGMLFWRMHRTARIIFSLSFHLGSMTPQECIDFLVERVGHERANAEGEVRRSFNGSYSPLYQVAYMIGGLQFRALHRELVGSKKMSNRDFHDTILQRGEMPVEMVRASLTGQPLTRDYKARWKFYDAPRVQSTESGEKR
ncbi:MAG TPA: DUF885 family protein [Vicinamibacterales bacterium]|jgi:uncharacterized protein (DUF885 family)|nr:DUF885 family protein [Vicinamibacterales bacterium]